MKYGLRWRLSRHPYRILSPAGYHQPIYAFLKMGVFVGADRPGRFGHQGAQPSGRHNYHKDGQGGQGQSQDTEAKGTQIQRRRRPEQQQHVFEEYDDNREYPCIYQE